MEQKEPENHSSVKEQSELEKYKKNLHSNIICYQIWLEKNKFYYNNICFIDLVVAYKKLTLEKNALEETLKASSNYDKDDVSETDTSEVYKIIMHFISLAFEFLNKLLHPFLNIFLILQSNLNFIIDI